MFGLVFLAKIAQLCISHISRDALSFDLQWAGQVAGGDVAYLTEASWLLRLFWTNILIYYCSTSQVNMCL